MSFNILKKIFFFSFLTLFFGLIIFFVKNFYFNLNDTINENIEEKYIEPVVLEAPRESLYEKIKKNSTEDNLENPKEIKEKRVIVNYVFLPNSFKKNLKAVVYRNNLDKFFSSEIINNKLEFLDVYFYRDKKEVRGRMKNAKVHIFGLLTMPKKEFVAVSTHEFGHFLDLYILQKNKFGDDISNIFYNISWKTTLVLKKGQTQKDFVSGYSITNKYEDFAESFTYYILHNKDFLQKAQKSEILKKKYIFFNKHVFTNNEFVNFDDGKKEKIKNYYRDITKIDYILEDFLEMVSSFEK